MAEIVVKLVNGELAGKTAQSINKEVSAAALALKKAEVGTKEWIKANEKLEGAKKLQADLKKQIDGTTDASNLLKKSWNSLPGAQYFNQVGESFGFMKKGVGGLISQFGMLKTAIASTGIGLLVLALSSLISYFTTTQEGIDKITAVTRPLKAIFEALIGVLQNLGGKVFKQLSEAIQNPMQALKDLGNILLENVINRFKAFALIGPAISKLLKGDLAGGFKDLGNAALQAVTGVEDVIGKVTEAGKAIVKVVDEAYAKGKRLDELQKQIERAEINQIVRSKQLELVIKQQKAIVEDLTKSYDERRKAAQTALDAQQELLKGELALLDMRIAKMVLEQSLNDTSREQEKELAELRAKRLEMEAKITEQSIEFSKKLQEIDKAQQAERDLKIQREKEEAERDRKNKEEALARQTEHNKKLLQDSEKWAEEQIKLEQEKADFAREMDEVRMDSSRQLTDFLAESIARQVGDEQAAKRVKKAAGLVDIFLNLLKEKSANAAMAAANPLNSLTFGAAGAAQLLALNQASNIRAAISAARILTFRKGGIPDGVLHGPSHERGGIPLVAEGKEIILSKGVYYNPALRRAASAINVAGGGRSFAAGGPVNPFDASRGPVASGRAGSGDSQLIDYKMMREIFREATREEIYKIQVTNNLQDTNKGLSVLNQLKSEADV
jgi:hypothetical protein